MVCAMPWPWRQTRQNEIICIMIGLASPYGKAVIAFRWSLYEKAADKADADAPLKQLPIYYRARCALGTAKARTSSASLLVPANESLHFLQGNGAIVVGIHRLEYPLVSRLKLLQ